MSKIKQLAFEEAQKIAAGEVVERPANILKELLENALDAGASRITVYIEQAGKKLIRVIDDGCGMELADIKACVLPHATSKIERVEQLTAVSTYGFRGEAMASIAAVTQLQITSKEADASVGWQCRFSNGHCIDELQVACSAGTDVQVADLFYNVPVRKKFLKQDETEWTAIKQLVDAAVLSHHSVFFMLYRDGKLVLSAPPVVAHDARLAQVVDYQAAQQFISLQVAAEGDQKLGLRLDGLISQPQYWRYNKQQIIFFVNKRWIRDSELTRHFIKGYNNILPLGKFPACCVFITLDPVHVDVNVHPKKEEVRFSQPNRVYQALMASVEATLRRELGAAVKTATAPMYDSPVMPASLRDLPLPSWRNFQSTQSAVEDDNRLPKNVTRVPVFASLGNNVFNDTSVGAGLVDSFPTQVLEFREPMAAQQNSFTRVADESTDPISGSIVGQLFDTYIIIDRGNEFVMVDQHAAHERVLYERMISRVAEREGTLLLFPLMITVGRELMNAFETHKDFFASFGFEVDQCSADAVAVKAVPTGVQSIDVQDIVLTALTLAQQSKGLDHEALRKLLYEHMHSHLACKRAVKAGDVLSREQMEKLLHDLVKCEKPFICVHGRPTLWKMPRAQLERNFQRR